jgi:outer membrane protein insertion porin family
MCAPLLGVALFLPFCASSLFAQATQPAAVLRPGPTPELAGRTVEDVQIFGNTTVSNALIINNIQTHRSDRFDPAKVQQDYQRIYDLKKFSNVQARVEPTQSGGVIVIFEVQEQRLISKITFRGNRAISTNDLIKDIDLKVGQAIDTFRISIARQMIANHYRDENYPLAHVEMPAEPLTQRGEVVFEIIEGPKVTVRKIDFKGANSISKDRLRDQVKTAVWFPVFSAGKYDPDQVDADVAAVRHYYDQHGFFDARVGRKLIFSPDQTELEIDFVIDEGPRYTVNKIIFEGNNHLSEAVLRKNLKLTEGRFFDEETLQRDQKEIIRAYSPLGYIYVQPSATSQTDPDYLQFARGEPQRVFARERGRVDIVYSIHEGKPFHLGEIRVKGNTKSQDKLVLREFREMTPGSLYNSGDVQDAVDRLRGLPYFAGVTATPIGDNPEYRDELVEVQEQRTAEFRIGAGINSNGGVGGNITYSQRNFDLGNPPNDWRDILSDHSFTGAGQTLRLNFSPGTIASNASASFFEPYLFDLPYSFGEEVYLTDRIREHYDDRRVGDTITFGKRFDYIWSASTSLRLERVSVRAVEDQKYRPEEILAERGHHVLTSVGFQVRRDTTNPGVFPYQGTVTTFGYELYGALGGEYNFHKLRLNWDGYQTVYQDLLDRRTVVRLSGFAGYINGRSTFLERFYEGGIGSVRGFRFRGVSPRSGRGDDPVGGDFAVTGTAELNFPIYQETLRGVVFTDIGDVESDVRLGTIRTSVGSGIRLVLPFLGQTPIAIDFAVPLNSNRRDDKQLISFSLGFSQ